MSDPWEPEIRVDRELVARRVARDWPELAGVAGVHAGSGFDLDVWRFGRVALRFPRRMSAVGLLEGERVALEWLEGRVPTAIPRVVGWAPPRDDAYPCPVLAVEWVDGASSDELAHPGPALAAELAGVLSALHGLDPHGARASGLADRSSKSELERRGARNAPRVDQLVGTFPAERLERARAELLAPLPSPGPTVVAHTDVYPRHVLVDRGALAGVIDWGDAGLSDRAADLSIAFTLFEGDARDEFFRSYGTISEDDLARARRMALIYGVLLGGWGLSIGDQRFLSVARRVLAE